MLLRVNSLEGKICQISFQVPILYPFPSHEYLVTYGHWDFYVLLRLYTCCYNFIVEKFVKLVSSFQFYISFQPTNTFLHIFIGLVTCCYALLPVVIYLDGKSFVKLVPRFPFYIRFQPTNTLLHMFIGLFTCCCALLPVVTSLEGKILSN